VPLLKIRNLRVGRTDLPQIIREHRLVIGISGAWGIFDIFLAFETKVTQM